LDALKRLPASHAFDVQSCNLFDLIALLLAESCERLTRGGLLANYRELDDDLPVLRGRLLVREQVTKRRGRLDRLECRHDEHSTDVVENQILAAALKACGLRVQHPAVSLQVRRLMGIFSEACTADALDLRLARTTVIYDRMNEHYRQAHSLAWLVMDGLGIEDLLSGTTHQTFAFLLDMNRLFEDFVTRWLYSLVRDTSWIVTAQRRDSTILWNADRDRPYTQVIPDLLVKQTNAPRVVPIDAKYKLYDEKNIAAADICQAFLYAYAYGQQDGVLPRAIIVFPASLQSSTVRLHVRRSAGSPQAEVLGIGVHVPSALAEAIMRQIGPQSQMVRQCLTAVGP
jgi:5-methylcytosine-specific restriction enzyme subunit McrC